MIALVCVKLRSKNAGWLLFLFGFFVVSRTQIFVLFIILRFLQIFIVISQLFADSFEYGN